MHVLLLLPAAICAAQVQLADAIHGITSQCATHDYEACNSFATEALASCSPGDLMCQCNQVNGIKEYCAAVCMTSNTHTATSRFLQENCKEITIQPSRTSGIIDHILFRTDRSQKEIHDGQDDEAPAAAYLEPALIPFKRAARKLPAELANELSIHNILDPHSPRVTLNALENQLRPLIAQLRTMVSEEEQALLDAKAAAEADDEEPENNDEKPTIKDHTTHSNYGVNSTTGKSKRDFIVHHVDCCSSEAERVALVQDMLASAESLQREYDVYSSTLISETVVDTDDSSESESHLETNPHSDMKAVRLASSAESIDEAERIWEIEEAESQAEARAGGNTEHEYDGPYKSLSNYERNSHGTWTADSTPGRAKIRRTLPESELSGSIPVAANASPRTSLSQNPARNNTSQLHKSIGAGRFDALRARVHAWIDDSKAALHTGEMEVKTFQSGTNHPKEREAINRVQVSSGTSELTTSSANLDDNSSSSRDTAISTPETSATLSSVETEIASTTPLGSESYTGRNESRGTSHQRGHHRPTKTCSANTTASRTSQLARSATVNHTAHSGSAAATQNNGTHTTAGSGSTRSSLELASTSSSRKNDGNILVKTFSVTLAIIVLSSLLP